MVNTLEKEPVEAEEKPRLGRTVLDDFKRGDFGLSMRRDLEDVLQFYLDSDSLQELREMGRFKRWWFSSWWLLKSMLFKLNPTRRILLLAAILLFLYGQAENLGFWIFMGFAGVLAVLMLELKDKLLAQDELASGRAVQFALMPERAPDFPGWDVFLYTRPANDVGGDLVDYLRVNDSRLALAIGDVAGKGLPAALFMAKLQATIRALAPDHQSLSSLGAEINRIFWRDKLPNRFASLVYFEIGSDSGTVRVLNAGHMPPLHLDREGVRTLRHGDVALGLTRDHEFTEQSIDAAPGDVIVAYSDGISEARNEEGRFFGEERLRRLIGRLHNRSAADVGAAILESVDDFIGDARPSDDLSLVILRRRSS
ncbi:MAG: PP2C family protein-serine/threonine phosphatase [Rhodothermales bacterium]